MMAWRCDLCGHVWLARDPEPPDLCAKCRKRRWFTGKWKGDVDTGGQEGLEIGVSEGCVLKLIHVEGVGVVLLKVFSPVETREHVTLPEEDAAKLDDAMPDAAIKEMLVKRRSRALAEGDKGAAEAFDAAIAKLTDAPPALPEGLDLRKKLLILKQWWRAIISSCDDGPDDAIRTFFHRTLAPFEYTQVTAALFHHPPPPEPSEWEPIIYLLRCKAAQIERGDTHMEQVYREAADRLEQDFKNGGWPSRQAHKAKKKAAKSAVKNQESALEKLPSKTGDA